MEQSSGFNNVFRIEFPKSEWSNYYEKHNTEYGWAAYAWSLSSKDVTKFNDVLRLGLYDCLFAIGITNSENKIEAKINQAINHKYKH